MIEQLNDVAKNVILIQYNKIWEQGRIPYVWNHSVILAEKTKPGRWKIEVKNDIPIAKNSNLSKLMEKIIT